MPSTAGTYADPQSWDGIAGAKIALAAGYAITTGNGMSLVLEIQILQLIGFILL